MVSGPPGAGEPWKVEKMYPVSEAGVRTSAFSPVAVWLSTTDVNLGLHL